jgi:hypothetical protein
MTKKKEKEKLQINQEFKNWRNKPALGWVWFGIWIDFYCLFGWVI